jgi:hypothetical protein
MAWVKVQRRGKRAFAASNTTLGQENSIYRLFR